MRESNNADPRGVQHELTKGNVMVRSGARSGVLSDLLDTTTSVGLNASLLSVLWVVGSRGRDRLRRVDGDRAGRGAALQPLPAGHLRRWLVSRPGHGVDLETYLN